MKLVALSEDIELERPLREKKRDRQAIKASAVKSLAISKCTALVAK